MVRGLFWEACGTNQMRLFHSLPTVVLLLLQCSISAHKSVDEKGLSFRGEGHALGLQPTMISGSLPILLCLLKINLHSAGLLKD